MVKKHYSSQNCRVDRIRRLRSAVEDHILMIKTQIAKDIDPSEPGKEGDELQRVLLRPIFRHCLSITREKKPDMTRPKEGWVGAGNLGLMERTDLGCVSEEDEVQ